MRSIWNKRTAGTKGGKREGGPVWATSHANHGPSSKESRVAKESAVNDVADKHSRKCTHALREEGRGWRH